MIRTAEPSDWPLLKPIFQRYHAEKGMAPLNMDKFRGLAMRQIERDLVLVAERDGNLIGGLGLLEAAWAYSDWTFLADFFMYLLPEARGGAELGELVQAAKDIAEAFGVPCFLTIRDETRAARRGKIADLFGFIPVGYIVSLGLRAGIEV